MPQIGPMSFKCRQPPSLAVSPFLAVVLPPSPSLSLSRVISQQTALSQFGCTLGLGSSALLQTVSHQCATARHYRLQSNCHTPQGTLSKGTNPASTPSPPTLAFKKKEKKNRSHPCTKFSHPTSHCDGCTKLPEAWKWSLKTFISWCRLSPWSHGP